MILVDTSVWIDYLRGGHEPTTERFQEVLDHDLPFGITGLIYQEVLQGARTEADFDRLATYLGSQRFYAPQDPVSSYEDAARLYFDCRRQGVTVRNTVDCLIAGVALEHDLMLLHRDADYDRIGRVVPALRTY